MFIALEHIDKTFGTGEYAVQVLKDISLTIERGEYAAIMGPSGSGKSTLMNIIGCLDTPTAGRYLLDGEDIGSRTDDQLSRLRNQTIGFVFQNFHLLPRETAQYNAALPLLYAGVDRRTRMERAAAALEAVGLGDRLEFLPNQMSGGQNQRIAIARAMINQPDLLLADEPTGALDSASGQQIMDLFRKLNQQGVTIIMITHDRSIAEHADRVIQIRDGRIYEGEDAAWLG